MLKKIWKDSVGSKVIATGIIGIITILYLKFESYSEEISFTEAYNKIVSFKVSLFFVVIIILLVIIVNSIIRKFVKSRKGIYNKKQLELKKFNRTEDPEINLLFKWIVYFKQNGTPFISDLNIFCTNHEDAPLKLVNGNCQINDCKNHRIRFNTQAAENHIESLVINEWDRLNE